MTDGHAKVRNELKLEYVKSVKISLCNICGSHNLGMAMAGSLC